MAKRAGSAGSRKKEVKTLFGNDEHEESLYVHQAKLESSIMNELRDDATLFNRVSKSKAAEKIGERGGASKIDLEATGAQAEESARVHQLFDQLIDRHPTISRAFKRGAERIADGESKAVVQRETHEEVSNALKDFLSGKADPFAA
jgi:hypothetical protein